MAWVTPSTRVNGDIITATIWNQDVVSNAISQRRIFANATDIGTVSDTTSLTSFGTISTLPSGLADGDVIVVEGDILVVSIFQNGSQGFQLDIQIGGTTVADTGSNFFFCVTTASQTNVGMWFTAAMHVRSSATKTRGSMGVSVGRVAAVQDILGGKWNVDTADTTVTLTGNPALTVRGKFLVNTGSSESMTLVNVRMWLR